MKSKAKALASAQLWIIWALFSFYKASFYHGYFL
jgi:hypothetical protein